MESIFRRFSGGTSRATGRSVARPIFVLDSWRRLLPFRRQLCRGNHRVERARRPFVFRCRVLLASSVRNGTPRVTLVCEASCLNCGQRLGSLNRDSRFITIDQHRLFCRQCLNHFRRDASFFEVRVATTQRPISGATGFKRIGAVRLCVHARKLQHIRRAQRNYARHRFVQGIRVAFLRRAFRFQAHYCSK